MESTLGGCFILNSSFAFSFGRQVSAALHNAQLIEMEKAGALAQLTSRLAHEINNPLQAVDSCLVLIKEELEGGPHGDRLERHLAVAMEEVRRISDMVRRMHDCYDSEPDTQ